MIHPSQSNSVPIFHRESARARMRERRKEKGKKQTTLNSSIKLISTPLIYILIKWCASCQFLETPTPVTRLLGIRSISLVFLFFFFFFLNQVNPSTLASLLNAPTHAYDSSNHKQSINSSRSKTQTAHTQIIHFGRRPPMPQTIQNIHCHFLARQTLSETIIHHVQDSKCGENPLLLDHCYCKLHTTN